MSVTQIGGPMTVATQSEPTIAGVTSPPLYGSIIAHVVLLAVATVLSVFKPKGRTPWGRRVVGVSEPVNAS